jgi:hypothetical protein
MTRWGLELALWGAETAQRVEVTRWGLELAVWGVETAQRVVKTRWGSMGPVTRSEGGGDRPTSREDSLGVDRACVEVEGERKSPQRVIMTRWGSLGPVTRSEGGGIPPNES